MLRRIQEVGVMEVINEDRTIKRFGGLNILSFQIIFESKWRSIYSTGK